MFNVYGELGLKSIYSQVQVLEILYKMYKMSLLPLNRKLRFYSRGEFIESIYGFREDISDLFNVVGIKVYVSDFIDEVYLPTELEKDLVYDLHLFVNESMYLGEGLISFEIVNSKLLGLLKREGNSTALGYFFSKKETSELVHEVLAFTELYDFTGKEHMREVLKARAFVLGTIIEEDNKISITVMPEDAESAYFNLAYLLDFIGEYKEGD